MKYLGGFGFMFTGLFLSFGLCIFRKKKTFHPGMADLEFAEDSRDLFCALEFFYRYSKDYTGFISRLPGEELS